MNAYGCDVLIVEDDQALCEELIDALGRPGLHVTHANNRAQALEWAQSAPPRVALLDYNLPDCTGIELAEELRALLPRTAILLMSGRIESLPQETLRRIDIRVFINKPLPLRALREAVTQLVREPVARVANAPDWSGGPRS
jgi:DNA-binding response OmpR family regulator